MGIWRVKSHLFFTCSTYVVPECRLGKKLQMCLHKSKFVTCFYNKTLENRKERNIQSHGENFCSFSSEFFFRVVKPKLSEA